MEGYPHNKGGFALKKRGWGGTRVAFVRGSHCISDG